MEVYLQQQRKKTHSPQDGPDQQQIEETDEDEDKDHINTESTHGNYTQGGDGGLEDTPPVIIKSSTTMDPQSLTTSQPVQPWVQLENTVDQRISVNDGNEQLNKMLLRRRILFFSLFVMFHFYTKIIWACFLCLNIVGFTFKQ